MSFNKEKIVAKEVAIKAGRFLKKHFDSFDRSKNITVKSKYNIQTWADLAAEKIILSKLRLAFPDHHILSEESGENKKKSDYFWIIDPLDGTTNYSMHLPAYGVSIALAYKGKIVLGVTNIPELNEMTVAEIGKGSFRNGKKIKVSRQKDYRDSLLTFCHGSQFHDIKRAVKLYGKFKLKYLDFRQIGSAVLEFNFVAAGRTEAIMLPGANLYDVAAGALIVREAGGRVTDFQNNQWTIYSNDILASNALVHRQVLNIINESR
jgi:myo-inositol-1(or 4)-monophosphatase